MPAQAMKDLIAEMAKLVESPVTAENQEERNMELTKLRDQMTEVQREIDAENARIVEL